VSIHRTYRACKARSARGIGLSGLSALVLPVRSAEKKKERPTGDSTCWLPLLANGRSTPCRPHGLRVAAALDSCGGKRAPAIGIVLASRRIERCPVVVVLAASASSRSRRRSGVRPQALAQRHPPARSPSPRPSPGPHRRVSSSSPARFDRGPGRPTRYRVIDEDWNRKRADQASKTASLREISFSSFFLA
jgi:hypothetical protein